ncbi:MAG: methylthioribulose 1-phosphate dehydratase [Bacteroidota bacterium]|jgi:methylthioribulose-1-phosphate dehydratase
MGDLLILNELTQCIRELHRVGHSPATSTNYSCRDGNGKIWITRSGIDKSLMQSEDFIEISPEGTPLPPFETIPPSAETGIHCALYEFFPETKVILHSHELHSVVITSGREGISFEGYELQKAFTGVNTHEGKITVPVIPNSQDMNTIKQALLQRFDELKFGVFMIEKHGFYTWGSSVFEAKRLLEAFSYLCRAEVLRNR